MCSEEHPSTTTPSHSQPEAEALTRGNAEPTSLRVHEAGTIWLKNLGWSRARHYPTPPTHAQIDEKLCTTAACAASIIDGLRGYMAITQKAPETIISRAST